MVRAALGKQFKGVTLDDHRRWQQQIRTITRSFALGGLAILLLFGAATTAVIVSATRSAMAANREIVEALAETIAEIRRLIGISSLDAMGYVLLGIVVLVIASLCMLTSRIGVYRILKH